MEKQQILIKNLRTHSRYSRTFFCIVGHVTYFHFTLLKATHLGELIHSGIDRASRKLKVTRIATLELFFVQFSMLIIIIISTRKADV